jgi:hypothetical protein
MGAIRKGVFMGAAVAAAGEQDFFFGAREQGEAMEKHLRSPESMRNTHTELEAFVEEQGREYQRRLLQAHFELRAARERPVQVRGADGVPRNKCRPSARPLMTVVGKVEVPRLAYQAAGVPGLHPMDAALNLPEEMYSHSVRRRVAEDVAARSFDEVVVELPQTSGAEVPKRQVEELAARAAQDFDAFYATREVIAEETDDLLVLSFDGKGVAMRHNDLRPATKKAAKAGRRKLATRLTCDDPANPAASICKRAEGGGRKPCRTPEAMSVAVAEPKRSARRRREARTQPRPRPAPSKSREPCSGRHWRESSSRASRSQVAGS